MRPAKIYGKSSTSKVRSIAAGDGAIADAIEAMERTFKWEPAPPAEPEDYVLWAKSVCEEANAALKAGVEPSHVAEVGDRAYATVAQFLPVDLSQWPDWSSPVLSEAASRVTSAQSVSMARDAATTSSNQHPQSAAAPTASTSRKVSQGPRKLAMLEEKGASKGDDEAPPAKKRKLSRKPVKKIWPQCDQCTSVKSIESCIVIPGKSRCERCREKKKGCWNVFQPYVEWYLEQDRAASEASSASASSARQKVSGGDTDISDGLVREAPSSHAVKKQRVAIRSANEMPDECRPAQAEPSAALPQLSQAKGRGVEEKDAEPSTWSALMRPWSAPSVPWRTHVECIEFLLAKDVGANLPDKQLNRVCSLRTERVSLESRILSTLARLEEIDKEERRILDSAKQAPRE